MLLPSWDHTHNIIEQHPSIMWAYNTHIISSRDSRIPWVGYESLFLLMCFYRRKFEGSRKGALSLTSNLLVMLIHSGPLYDWAFNSRAWTILLGIQCSHDAFMDPMWHNYVKCWVKILSYLTKITHGCQEFEVLFCESQANGLIDTYVTLDVWIHNKKTLMTT